MTSRSDGTNTTTYAWDDDNRLTLVTLPSSATVAYTYDVLGRMLTRTDSSGTTYFTWDGWNMVAELAPNGTQTRYYAPNGELLYFEVETATTDQPAVYGSAYYGQNYYGALAYSVVSDGLGSVRRIVDSYNNVVSILDYDAYGQQLLSTSDPLGFPYRYVGSLGVRWDQGIGLYYVLNRWYDSTLQRFLSRDLAALGNLYSYCWNSPTVFVDINGRDPVKDPLLPPGNDQAKPYPKVDHKAFLDKNGNANFQDEQPGTFNLDADIFSALEKMCPMNNCFMVCVRHDGPKHPFLVFPGTSSNPEYEFFGDKLQDDGSAFVTHKDYETLNTKAHPDAKLRCHWYCTDGAHYNAVYYYATSNVALHPYDKPESIFWVNDALKAGGIPWPTFGDVPTRP